MSKTTTVRARIDSTLKNKATVILESRGLDTSTAIRLFLAKVIEVNGLPFNLKSDKAEEEKV